MSNIWVISDTHFNHTNIIEYCGRPFSNSKEMDELILDRWNETVKPQDKVYHLGDVYFGNPNGYSSYLLSMLNGKKRLILGNHDSGKDQILQRTFQKIELWRMFPEFGLLLTHIPVHESTLIKSGRNGNPDMQLVNVHGHIHQRKSPDGPYKCVCVEQTDYLPVNIEDLRVI